MALYLILRTFQIFLCYLNYVQLWSLCLVVIISIERLKSIERAWGVLANEIISKALTIHSYCCYIWFINGRCDSNYTNLWLHTLTLQNDCKMTALLQSNMRYIHLLILLSSISIHFLNQARASRRLVYTWFLEIDFVHDVCISVCVCTCPLLRLLIISDIIWTLAI